MTYVPGKGTELKLSIASIYTGISQVQKITPPSGEMGTVETTHLLSSAKEYMSTILDGGELTFTIEWDPSDATHQELWSAFKSGATRSWQTVFNDAGNATVAHDGIITGFPWDEADVESVITIPITIKISGDIVLTL